VEEGVTGFLVPPKNAAALADAIGRILNHRDLAAAMGRAGRVRVSERFSTRAMVSDSERLYAQLLAQACASR
jgi:glycosyltransferase involved in cell wall biosynthesis